MALFGKKKSNDDPFGDVPPVPGMQQDANSMQPDMNQMQQPGQQQDSYYDQGQPDMGQPPDMNQQGIDQMQGGQDPYGQQYADQGRNDMNFSSPESQQPLAPQDNIREKVEEVAEAIIDEKWNELMKDINKIVEWKERTDTEIKKIEQEIIHLKERFESLHKGILGKITEYDQNLTNVGSEIKAMEKVFQNILPTFTENVNKLERITKGVSSKVK
ncbi:MAG: hypothetical protein KAK00_00840 [Nanoarchaeota archaeon]|nr:hypothetical protein [Thermodesulfovibrionia bacterium]MCK5281930.1 hypothetical protein [Nanoarchaeota archaeon]